VHYLATVTDELLALVREERDVRAICELKYRYLRTLDSKDWDGFEDCLVPEATGDYNGLVFDDRDALVSYMRENLGAGLVTLHQAHHPEIEVDGDAGDTGDTATGRWYLYDRVIVEAFSFMLEGGAFYTDRYVRTPDGWRVAHTGYRRTFEATYNLGDLPGFKLTGPGVHTHK
jgi:SnoaL-like domain